MQMKYDELYANLYSAHVKNFTMKKEKPKRRINTAKRFSRAFWKAIRWSFTLAAMFVSATHTVPLIQSTVPAGFKMNLGFTELGKEHFGWAGFIMLEGFALMISHRMSKKLKINKNIEVVSIVVFMLTLLVGNLYGSFFEGTGALSKDNGIYQGFVVVSKILMAFAAPIVAFISGLYEVQESQENKEADEAVMQEDDDRIAAWEREMKEEWMSSPSFSRLVALEKVIVSKEARSILDGQPVQQAQLPAPTKDVNQESNLRMTAKEIEYAKWAKVNDPTMAMPVRKVNEETGISTGTISSARSKLNRGATYE